MQNLKWIKFRVLCLSFGVLLFLGAILFRSYQLHIKDNSRVNRLAKRQHEATLPLKPKRGSILDKNSEPLALDVEVASVAVHPKQINEPEQLVNKLSPLLKVKKSELLKKVKSQKSFVWLARRISSETGDQIKDFNFDGVVVSREYKRYYPNKELAGHLLGAVGYDAKALGGLELAYDKFLKVSPEKLKAQKDAKGRLYTPLSYKEKAHDLVLTIDRNLQYVTEKYLWQTAEKYKAQKAFAIVSNPHTGEILAIANYPTFNPNSYWNYPLQKWKNHALVSNFEPGSTFKPFLVASSLESGLVKSQDKFDCENGRYRIGRNYINDHHPYEILDVKEIIKYSSNIGVTKIAEKIGKNKFYETLQDFGFGEKTGIDFPGEENGIVAPSKRWRPIDFSNIAFGQGIAVSGIQMVQAYGALANGGAVMKPYLIKEIHDAHRKVIFENKPSQVRKVIKESVAKDISEMMTSVVQEDGTGKKARIPGYLVAGKTGTAQKVNPETKTYDKDDYVSSFIGYVPADKPRFVIYVLVDSPKPIHVGGLVAAPVFKKIAEEALVYYGVLPRDSELALSSL